MQRGTKDREIREFHCDVRQPEPDVTPLVAGEIDILTLAMRQLMQAPGRSLGLPQSI